ETPSTGRDRTRGGGIWTRGVDAPSAPAAAGSALLPADPDPVEDLTAAGAVELLVGPVDRDGRHGDPPLAQGAQVVVGGGAHRLGRPGEPVVGGLARVDALLVGVVELGHAL